MTGTRVERSLLYANRVWRDVDRKRKIVVMPQLNR